MTHHSSKGFNLQYLVELESTDLLVIVLVFAVIGILFCLFVLGVGILAAGKRVVAAYKAETAPCSCTHSPHSPPPQKYGEDGNNIDVNVHPTDTTIAAGGSALVAPHYNVALMNLTEMQYPSCPQMPPGMVHHQRPQQPAGAQYYPNGPAPWMGLPARR
ncbi:uncharacterized protein LOC135365883 [Ornithodoros turicata]|uniref:uncharacterized protein LOC135365883 n=1 Tax=Ornithodoros turicata TaxID=34597 RepID=UPI0031397FFA